MYKLIVKLSIIILVVILSGCLDEKSQQIKFIIVGDPNIKMTNTTDRGNEKLKQIVDFINQQDVDFAVFMGDMTVSGKRKTSSEAKKILKNMTKPYYVVPGDQDILVSENIFERVFGPATRTEYINGYQLIFAGTYDEWAANETIANESTKKTNKAIQRLNWSFNFSKADKNMPTLVFIHGPVKSPPPECNCTWHNYAESMSSELNRFTNLIAVYSGHVHYDSYQIFNGTKYITINGLVYNKTGGIMATPSNEIGYSIIEDNKLDYKLISYIK